MDDAMETMEPASDPMAGGDSAPTDPFDIEADTFLDDSLPMPDRRAALKEAIRLCMDEDKAGGYGGGPPGGGKGDSLALIFGEPKKKS